IAELVRRSQWGANFYGARIESAFTQYYFNPATDGWEATAKSGNTYYYGTTAASRQHDPYNPNRIFKWCLDRVEDTNGNYMTVSYIKHAGQIYPQQIDYTGNSKTGAAPRNYVRFYLDTQRRADAYPVLTSNFEVTTARKLKSIEVIGNGQLARAYKLTYTESDSTLRTLLTRVQQYGSDASIDGAGNVSGAHVLPAIKFDWVTDAHNTFSSAFYSDDGIENFNFGSERDRALAFDYNGDGKSDLFLYRPDGKRAAVARWDEKNQTYEQIFYSSNGIGRFTFDSIRDRALAFDYNGDGKSDLFLYRPNSGIASIVKWNEQIQAFEEVYYSQNGIAGFNFGSDRDRAFAFDYNGDGYSDLFLYRPDSGKVYIAKSHGNGNFSAVYSSSQGIGSFNFNSSRDTGFPFDFNGDGYSDLFLYRPDSGKACVIRSNGNDTFTEVFYSTKGMGDYNLKGSKDQAFPFDFNADGQSDIFLYRPDSNLVGIMRSHGDGSFEQVYYSHSGIAGYSISSSRDRVFPFDYNGDGKSDIFLYRPDSGRVGVGRSLGDGTFERVYYATNGIGGHDFRRQKDQAFPLDYDGDGKSDIFMFTPNSELCGIAQSGFHYPDLLSKIDNGSGGITEIEYTPSSHYKNTKLNFIVHPVSKITIDDGFSNLSIKAFNYVGGYFHSGSREFRGFKTVVQTNAVDSPYETITETKFHQDYYRKGRQYQEKLKAPETNAVLSKTSFTWDRLYFNSSAFVRLLEKRTESYDDVTVTSKEVYTYDDVNGNLLSKTVSGTNAESVTLYYRYAKLGGWMWRKTRETVTGSVSSYVRRTDYEYDNDTGNLLLKRFWLRGIPSSSYPKIEMTYDQYGNQKTVIDPRGNTTTTDYDTATRTFPIKITYPKTNGIAHVVRNEAWDYRFGKVTITKDENGNRTYYDYDEFGRPVRVNSPNGGQVTTTYVDDEFPRYVVTKVKENDSGNTIDAYQYLDGLGRDIQTITFGEDGQSIVTQKLYDALGRNDLTKGPFFAGGVGYPLEASGLYPWQQTNFDLRGRPEIIQNGDGEYGFFALIFSYSGLSTTVEDDDEGSKTEIKDYLGRVIRVVEHADGANYTTDYTYNAAGDLLTVRDHYNNTTTIDYDTLGRKTSMNDPNMGYWEYTYDANGNLLTQTDEKLQTVTFAYDALNRVTSKTYSTAGSTVTYQYDNLAISNGRGRLYRVSNAYSTTTYNAYDKMGNVTRESKTIAGNATTHTTRYEYDLAGRITRTIYPDGYAVRNDYHPGSGLLASVRDPQEKLLAYLSNYTPGGKIGKIQYHNAVVTQYEYDPESTRLMSILTHGTQVVSNHSASASFGASQSVQSSSNNQSAAMIWMPSPVKQVYHQMKSYRYTPAGDIKEIHDSIAGASFYFTYDKLHRLKSETNTSSYDPISYTYDAVGNLRSKTVGSRRIDYIYDTWHKHAVKTIKLNGFDHQYEYDDNGNMISGPDFSDPAQVATRSISYNADNMPTRIVHNKGSRRLTTDFVYDGDGVRVKKIIAGNRTTYYIGAHYEIKNGVTFKYIFAGNLRIAQISASGTQYFHK
ncbi:MAG: FG-GAP-like repeat-containing protein, partial [Desulfobacterales bacterium]